MKFFCKNVQKYFIYRWAELGKEMYMVEMKGYEKILKWAT
jgi:hypothetical protein